MTGGDSLTEDLNLFYNAGDIAWMITATALVLLMIPGVGYVHMYFLTADCTRSLTRRITTAAFSTPALLDANRHSHSFGCPSVPPP